jgi:PKD repeat protein
LFVTSRYGGNATEIVVMNPDGSGVTRLAPGETPTWSSDGTRIAFTYLDAWDPDQPWLPYIWAAVINADGAGLNWVAWGYGPAWRPFPGGLNDRPVASAIFQCIERTCTFDGLPSSDSDGHLVSYGWQFGDGATDSGATVTHTFAGGRTYGVRLIVMDDDGALGTSSRSVDLNQPPVASFTASCSELTCSFNGSATSDDGKVTYYSWSFGDGTTASGVTASRTYAAGGTYTVTLTVTDNSAATGTQAQSVTVVVPPHIHVGDPDRASTSQSTKWTATVTIRIHDISHGPAANATVSGSWNNGSAGSCTTNASGQCAVSRSGILKTTSSVALPSRTWRARRLCISPRTITTPTVTATEPPSP